MPITYLDEEVAPKRKITYLDNEKTTPLLPQQQKTEQLISERPDAWQRLMEEYRTPYDFKKHPLKSTLKPFVTALKTFAVPLQRGEAAISTPALRFQSSFMAPESGFSYTDEELQKGISPEEEKKRTQQRFEFVKQLGKNAWQGLTGKRPAEFGDLIRTTGFGGDANELLASTVGFFAQMGGVNAISKGAAVKGTNKGLTFLKSKTPQIMNKDYVLSRAKIADEGLGGLYKGLSGEYEKVFAKIGNNPVDFTKVNTVLDDLVNQGQQTVVNKMAKVVGKNPPSVVNTLQRIKETLRNSVPDKVWSGKVIGDTNQHFLKEAYYKLNDIIAKDNGELLALNKRYRNFMQMRDTLGHVLYDSEGNVKAEGLQRLFSPSGARHIQKYFEEYTKMYPRAAQIMKDIVKFNKRLATKKFAIRTLGYGLAGGLGYYGLRKGLSRLSGEE